MKFSLRSSGTRGVRQEQRRQVQVERTSEGVVYHIQPRVLPHAEAVQGAVAEPPGPQQVQGRVVAEGRLRADQPRTN